MISQIPWDPSAFIGFDSEQLALIKRGFDFALDRAYEKERRRTLADIPDSKLTASDRVIKYGGYDPQAC